MRLLGFILGMVIIAPCFAAPYSYEQWYYQHHYNKKKCEYLKPHLNNKSDRWQCGAYGPHFFLYPEYPERDPYGFEPSEELKQFDKKKELPYRY